MEPYQAIERNLRTAMQCFARAAPGSEVRETAGVLITNAAVESPVFNAAMFSEAVPADPVELDRRIAVAKVYFDARELDWSFWVCEQMVPRELRHQQDRLFERRGLRRASECPGMIGESLPPVGRPLPELEIRPVADAETRLAFCHITTVCFRIPFATSVAIYNTPATWETGFTAFVGYQGNEAVATAATLKAGGVVGLYSVATLPEHQGRGIGEKLTRHALDQAGGGRTVLQSTRQGNSLYRRLGFREVTRVIVYLAR